MSGESERASPASIQASRKQLQHSIVAHYEEQLRRHGATARGMDWKDSASQQLRFALLCAVARLDGCSLHEVGSGAGHLVDYLEEKGIAAEYSGSDLSHAMIEAARSRHPRVSFECRDILAESHAGSYDYVLCSGLFFVKLGHNDEVWLEFVRAMLRRMYAMCGVGLAFNMMSNRVDYRSRTLYYSDPGEILDFCARELSKYAVVRHDYPLFEYTVYVYRQPTVAE